MSRKLKRILSVALALAMIFALTACVKTGETEAEKENDTLVVGYSYFSQKFSPFFSTTGYDEDAAMMTQVMLMETDREGNPVLNGIKGETITYNGTEYDYSGIGDIEVVRNEDGTVDYNITIRDDVVFSDGFPMTIDDVIFSMYVLSDPSYDGGSVFYTLPIEGMDAYRSSMATLSSLILAAGPDNSDFSLWTIEQQTQYWTAFNAGGEKFVQEIVDYCVANIGGIEDAYNSDVAVGMINWGYGSIDEAGVLTTAVTGKTFDLAAGVMPTVTDFWDEIIALYGYDLSDSGINYESAGTGIGAFISAELGEDATAFSAGITIGEAVPIITGIERTGAYSMTVHATRFEAASIYQFNIPVAPLHYYGDVNIYNYSKNLFGFNKGDLSVVKARTTVPMGAGPYKFVSYENGVITFEANNKYWEGEPKTKYVLFQECADSDKLAGVVSGSFDLTDPDFSAATIASIKDYNTNGELTGDVITTSTVDNLGYGYIGICAANVKVGSGPSSFESKCLRKAFGTLFAAYRDTVINSYYGDQASVIQYPISNTSWAAPRPADEGYRIAYSVDVDGNPIYTDGMTDEARGEAALNAAIGYLKAAGYTFDEATGMFTAAPAGAKMTYEIIIPADGTGDHPAYGILTAAKEALATIGITLQINDPADSNVLIEKLEAVPCGADMWAAAWEATPDPDLYQIYFSANINGAGGTESNHYYIRDKQLDELILAARESADQSFRKATYKQCLDIILDWGVEVPTYQRQNAFIFSTERIDMETVTPDITTFWNWMNDIQNIRVK